MELQSQNEFGFKPPSGGGRPDRSPPPRKPFNVYFALRPDERAAEQARRTAGDLRRRFGLREEPRAKRLLHVSLCHLGQWEEIPRSMLFDGLAAAASVRMRPFKVAFRRAVSFRQGKSALVLRADEGHQEVLSLHAQLALSLLNRGVDVHVRPKLEPHMTLLYDYRRVPETILPEPIVWTAKSFVLINSLTGEGRHEEIDEWPLLG
ncbi:2'-5' RNA ligase family protein [Rhizobium sp. P32RR-XVIII]|uniref:2'-5' RNA ligase family protein n=1 Tax=Rhizobium sp. P32RR-XVIII TaxID=2726738 RepID=UPI0014572637|nr:2'-5' RNA ligase family protein [Rhizobium sp. P32RR-XVIII]NLS01954.1 2'-5' RNA ligase family protein [Rhizobium sp. P32RR-XVIII]